MLTCLFDHLYALILIVLSRKVHVLASSISSTIEIHLQLVSWIYMRLFIWLEIVRNLSNEILPQLAT